VRTQTIPLSKAREALAWFALHEREYTTYETRYSVRIKSDNYHVVCTDTPLPVYCLGLQRSLLTASYDIDRRFLTDQRPQWYRYAAHLKSFDGLEYDLNAAYANELYAIGIRSDLVDKVMRLDKPLRLAVVGALAKRVFVRRYRDGKVYGKPELQVDRHGLIVWNTISYRVGAKMESYFDQYQGMFFWFDAIFFPSERGRVPVQNAKRKRISAAVGSQWIVLDDGRAFPRPKR
jgi:hypothetical protein